MKRDMDLVREILIALESSDDFEPSSDYVYDALDAKEFDKKREISWHLTLMDGAGLVKLKFADPSDNWSGDDAPLEGIRILWAGFDFLAEASNPKIWDAAKKRAGDAFYSLSIGTLQALLNAVARQAVGIS